MVEEGSGKQESDVKSRIPEGAEATTVLVGTLDELQYPVLAFVRLAKGCPLNITEVSIPVRFMFVLLGPSSEEESYYEIGRSVATLMSDQVCYSQIYMTSFILHVFWWVVIHNLSKDRHSHMKQITFILPWVSAVTDRRKRQ